MRGAVARCTRAPALQAAAPLRPPDLTPLTSDDAVRPPRTPCPRPHALRSTQPTPFPTPCMRPLTVLSAYVAARPCFSRPQLDRQHVSTAVRPRRRRNREGKRLQVCACASRSGGCACTASALRAAYLESLSRRNPSNLALQHVPSQSRDELMCGGRRAAGKLWGTIAGGLGEPLGFEDLRAWASTREPPLASSPFSSTPPGSWGHQARARGVAGGTQSVSAAKAAGAARQAAAPSAAHARACMHAHARSCVGG